MKKLRMVAGVAAAAPAALAAGVIAPAAAHASKWAGMAISAPILSHGAPGWSAASIRPVHRGSSVEVECYYSNASTFNSDPYWDHVTHVRPNPTQTINGHVDDLAVDFGGKFPKSVGLPHCAP